MDVDNDYRKPRTTSKTRQDTSVSLDRSDTMLVVPHVGNAGMSSAGVYFICSCLGSPVLIQVSGGLLDDSMAS